MGHSNSTLLALALRRVAASKFGESFPGFDLSRVFFFAVYSSMQNHNRMGKLAGWRSRDKQTACVKALGG